MWSVASCKGTKCKHRWPEQTTHFPTCIAPQQQTKAKPRTKKPTWLNVSNVATVVRVYRPCENKWPFFFILAWRTKTQGPHKPTNTVSLDASLTWTSHVWPLTQHEENSLKHPVYSKFAYTPSGYINVECWDSFPFLPRKCKLRVKNNRTQSGTSMENKCGKLCIGKNEGGWKGRGW